MDLLADDDDDEVVQQEPRRDTVQTSSSMPAPAPVSTIYDPFQMQRASAHADSIVRTSAARPPPQQVNTIHSSIPSTVSSSSEIQQNSRPLPPARPVVPTASAAAGPAVDVMSMLIRGSTSNASPEERALLEHIRQCLHGPGCQYPNCDVAKEKYKHFTQCTNKRCIQCAPARLVYCRQKNRMTDEIERNFKKSRIDLQQSIRSVKAMADMISEAKASGDPMRIAEAEKRSLEEKMKYDKSKKDYEDACERISIAWLEVRAQRQQQHQQQQQLQQHQQHSVPLQNAASSLSNKIPPPVGQQAKLNFPSSTTVAPSGSNVPLVQKVVPPTLVTPIKRSEEILDGHSMEFVFGELPNSILAELEAALELATLVSTSRDDDWLVKRSTSDLFEPDWSEYNVLTKAEIDNEQQKVLKGSKLLFSNRESEFLSRAIQELVTEILVESTQAVKHRRLTTDDPTIGPLEITARDIECTMLRRRNLPQLDL